MTLHRQIVAYKKYFLDFYTEQSEHVQAKIEWVLNLIRVSKQIPEKFFKHIEGTKGLYEIRVESKSNIYRIFAFFDKGNLVVLGNAFQKKHKRRLKKRLKKHLK